MRNAPDVPASGALDDYVCLFNSEAYHRANMGGDQVYVRIDHHEEGRLVGALAGVMDQDTLDCGWHAPFGGVDLASGAELPGRVADVVRAAVGEARRLGARRIRVRCRPAYYSTQEAVIQFALLSQDFSIEKVELALGIEMRGLANIAGYMHQMSRTARQGLRRGLSSELEWRLAVDELEWAAAYTVLRDNRAKRGVALKYGLDYLFAMADRFPGRVRMNLLNNAGATVAAALIYRVLPWVDYVVAWGHADGRSRPSPMSLVAYRVVEEALAAGVEVVDLGISSADGRADDGLVQFKRSVGATPGLRLDLVREL